MTRAEFRARLEALGLKLDPKAFDRAWEGAQGLSESAALVSKWLAKADD
ncbi:MAG: hypothetical protein LCH69_00740 [Proteobacteria bacterium]|nr:hypothetical protein [Pseudomonadota bacterium]